MRDYLEDLRENWRDEYWRADHPEFQLAVTIVAFLFLGLFRLAFTLAELLMERKLRVV